MPQLLSRARIQDDRVALIGGLTAVVLAGACVFVPLISDTNVNAPRLSDRLLAPVWLHGDGGLLGTDQLGRDLFLRLVYGLRTSYTVAVVAILLAATLGVIVGLAAGYFGGAVDSICMRIVDIQQAMPGLLLVITAVGVLGRDVWVLVVALALLAWPVHARVTRGAVLSLRSTDLLMATAWLGAGRTRILVRHLLPNIVPPVLATSMLEFAELMLAEAGLSFIGFGVQSPQVSLGAELASGRNFLLSQWWIATSAGAVLFAAVLSTTLLGSWMQQTFDPTQRSR